MCGIIVSSLPIPENAEKYVKNRGPDNKNIVTVNNITFIHYLLHLTGIKTMQPVIQNNVVCVFNGEIYNYKEININAKSDVYSIIESYNKYGEDFVKYLDGEFAIVMFDFNLNKLIISSDIFKTKPLFYNVNDNEIVISSYETACLSIKKQEYYSIKPNETLIFDLKTRTIVKKICIHEFSLNQYKKDYNDYINALEKAILKRYPENSIPLITLSSGLDSGAIACCLNKYNKDAIYFSILKNEDYNTLINRNKILKNHHLISNFSNNEKSYWNYILNNDCEPFTWNWMYNPNVNSIDDGFIMGSMLGKSKIMNEARKIDPKNRVMYSGIGADELMARNQYYSRGYGNVDFFSEDLQPIFPWPNLFEGSMENYLKGDEYVGGCYGYETRYPFCDKELVQEFLWLTPELKNCYNGSIYKPPLLHYLITNNFPYYNKKLGFNV